MRFITEQQPGSRTRTVVKHRTHTEGRFRAFTLIETALATVIVSTGVLSIVAAQQAYHHKNDWASNVGTAMLLANELRELTMPLPMHDPLTGIANMGAEADEIIVDDYDDLDDFAGIVASGVGVGTGITFNPPINALRQPINDMVGWSQTILVQNVLPENISVSDGLTQPLGSTDMMRVSVSVFYQVPNQPNPMLMTQLTWVVGRD